MSGPKRNPDKLNTVGVVVIGICASVLVYVTIVALQAFYMKDTSEIQTMADYGGNDTGFRSIKTTALNNINEYGKNPDNSFRVHIDVAMQKVAEDAKTKPEALVFGFTSTKASAEPIFGRSKPLGAAPAGAGSAAPTDGAGSAAPAGAGSAAPAGAGSAAPAGAGSAAPAGAGSGATTAPATGAGAGSSAATPAPAAPAGGAAATPTGGQGGGGGPAPTAGAKNPGANAGSGSAAKGNAP